MHIHNSAQNSDGMMTIDPHIHIEYKFMDTVHRQSF